MRKKVFCLLILSLAAACTTPRATQPVAYSTDITCDTAIDSFEIKPKRLENDVDSVTINGKRIETKTYDDICQLKDVSIQIKINYDQQETPILKEDNAPDILKPIIRTTGSRLYTHSQIENFIHYNGHTIAAIGYKPYEIKELNVIHKNELLQLNTKFIDNLQLPPRQENFSIADLINKPLIYKAAIIGSMNN